MRNFKIIMGSILVLLAPASLFAAGAEHKMHASSPHVTVIARQESAVAGTSIHVSDIAKVEGSDHSLMNRVEKIEVGVAPLPGLTRILLAGDIRVHLRAAGISDSQVSIQAPPQIIVRRQGINVTPSQLVQAAMPAALSLIQNIPHAFLVPDPTFGTITAPSGSLKIAAGQVYGSVQEGTLFVPVSVEVNGQTVQSSSITFRVHRKEPVLIANRDLEPRDILKPEDVTLRDTDMLPGAPEPVLQVDDAVGKRVTRRVLAGAVLPANALDIPPVISAGDNVTLLFLIGAVKITAIGTAQQSGKMGEMIRVYVSGTNKILNAQVLDHHTVIISEQ